MKAAFVWDEYGRDDKDEQIAYFSILIVQTEYLNYNSYSFQLEYNYIFISSLLFI